MKGQVWYLLATRTLLSEAADSTSLQAVDAWRWFGITFFHFVLIILNIINLVNSEIFNLLIFTQILMNQKSHKFIPEFISTIHEQKAAHFKTTAQSGGSCVKGWIRAMANPPQLKPKKWSMVTVFRLSENCFYSVPIGWVKMEKPSKTQDFDHPWKLKRKAAVTQLMIKCQRHSGGDETQFHHNNSQMEKME